MAHVVIIVEGNKVWYDVFISDLEKRQYTYQATHGMSGVIGPNIREIHALDISVPEQNLPDLFADLAPFLGEHGHDSPQKSMVIKVAQKLFGIFSKIAGAKLQKIPSSPKPSGLVRRKALNVYPVFWFEDPVDSRASGKDGLILPMKGDGGELL
jgi:hypothetical protein